MIRKLFIFSFLFLVFSVWAYQKYPAEHILAPNSIDGELIGDVKLENLSDIIINDISTKEVLLWDGTKWTNGNIDDLTGSDYMYVIEHIQVISPTNTFTLTYEPVGGVTCLFNRVVLQLEGIDFTRVGKEVDFGSGVEVGMEFTFIYLAKEE